MSNSTSLFRHNSRQIIFGIMLLAFVVLMVHQLSDVEKLLHTLRTGRPEWVALALLLQVGTLLNQPALYQSLYQLLDLPMRWREMVPVVWAAHFVNIVTPSAGLAGTALLIDQGRRLSLDISRVTLAITLYFLLNFVWFLILLGFSLVMLFLWHDLKTYEVAVAAIPMIGVLLALGALFLVSVRPQVFSRLAGGLCCIANRLSQRLLRREVLKEERASKFATTFASSVRTLRTARGRVVRPCLHAMLVDGLEICVLGACFAAFPGAGHQITPMMLVVGYAIGTLFLVVSVTPQGLGVVEGVMTATFVSLGVSLERAVVVVLVYRGLSFWLPLLVGFLASRSVLIKNTVT